MSNTLFAEIENSETQWDNVQNLFSVIPDKKYQVQTNQYLSNGVYAIVDQGKNDVVGYNDDTTKVFYDLPIIVYGDHTTIVKYRNKPFIVGGDGVKLLKPLSEFNSQYLYFALCQYNIKQEGYKRHFSILKNVLLPIPQAEVQINVANLLSWIEKEIVIAENILFNLIKQKHGLLQRMFV